MRFHEQPARQLHMLGNVSSDYEVRSLGPCTIRSPLELAHERGTGMPSYVPERARVLADVDLDASDAIDPKQSFERAGPRAKIFFEPKKTRVGIVTSGGLCPGINNVIRSIVLQCFHK